MTRKSTRSTAIATAKVEPANADGKLCTILRGGDGVVRDTLDANALRAILFVLALRHKKML
jgi:hypothetical protein